MPNTTSPVPLPAAAPDDPLRPCPFCASENVAVNQVAAFWVQCDKTDCSASTGDAPTRKQAIAAWNRRAAPVAPPVTNVHLLPRHGIRTVPVLGTVS